MFIPAEVQRYIDLLEEYDLSYEIEYDLPSKIRLVLRTDRVYADALFKQQGRRWHNAKPTLTIDGKPCDHSNSFAELKMIVTNPDAHLKVQELREKFPHGFTYAPNPPHPEHGVGVDHASVPEIVRSYRATLAPVLAKNPNVTYRFENPRVDLWQIRLSGLDEANSGEMVIMFGPKHLTWAIRSIMLVIVPGDENMGLDLGIDLSKALGAYVSLEARPVTTGPVAQARQAPRTKNDRLVEKRNTVIRN